MAAHYGKFGLEDDEPKVYEIKHPQSPRPKSSGPAKGISFWQTGRSDEIKQEAEIRRGLLDQIERLCIRPADRERIQTLCGQVSPESWPFGKYMRVLGSTKHPAERWGTDDLPAVALVLVSFHDRYSGSPALVTPDLEELRGRLPHSMFAVEDLRPMVLHLEHYLQCPPVAVQTQAEDASQAGKGHQVTSENRADEGAGSDPADGKPSEPTGAEGSKEPDPEALFSPKKLAELHDLPYERVRAMLRRLQTGDHNCFREVERVKPRDPQYLYRYGSVLPAIQKMKDKAKTASERPAKKKTR